MFIAHLPAGYLVATQLGDKIAATMPANQQQSRETLALVTACMIGSVLPDLDMIYFHLIDQRQHNHHTYWTHTPIYWIALFGLFSFFAELSNKSGIWKPLTFMFTAGLMTHLILDTVAEGGIRWLYPDDPRLFHLFDIPGGRFPRILNYVLHWTFAIELAICLWALARWLRRNPLPFKLLNLRQRG